MQGHFEIVNPEADELRLKSNDTLLEILSDDVYKLRNRIDAAANNQEVTDKIDHDELVGTIFQIKHILSEFAEYLGYKD